MVDALEMAVQRQRPGEGVMAHSDRGSRYASEHYQRALPAAAHRVWYHVFDEPEGQLLEERADRKLLCDIEEGTGPPRAVCQLVGSPPERV